MIQIPLKAKYFDPEIDFDDTRNCPFAKGAKDVLGLSEPWVGFTTIRDGRNYIGQLKDSYSHEQFDQDMAKAQQSVDPEEVIRILYFQPENQPS